MFSTIDNTSIHDFNNILLGKRHVLIPTLLRWLPVFIKSKIITLEYTDLMIQYHDEIGLPQSQINYLEKMKLYAKYIYQYYDGKKHMKINAQMALNEAKKGSGSSGGSSIYGVCAIISKWIGGRVSANEMTIREFHETINQMSLEAKNIESNGK